jgi:hypothetical protein
MNVVLQHNATQLGKDTQIVVHIQHISGQTDMRYMYSV